MGCSCKGNGSNRQVTQVTTRTGSVQKVKRATTNTDRKQIIIRRPAR